MQMHYANDAKTFLRHFSDCLFYFCSTFTDSRTACIRDGILAYCAIYSIGSSIAPDMSIKQSRKSISDNFHFRFPSKTMQIHYTHLILFCYTVIYSYWPTQCRNHHFHSVIWYLENAHSDRFQTFNIEKVCFLQCQPSIKSIGFG